MKSAAALLVSLADIFERAGDKEGARTALEEAILSDSEMGLSDKRDSPEARAVKPSPKPNPTPLVH